MKKALEQLRELVRREEYEISTHANEEMSNDDLVSIDVETLFSQERLKKGLPGMFEERAMKSSAKRVIIDPSWLYAESRETVVS